MVRVNLLLFLILILFSSCADEQISTDEKLVASYVAKINSQSLSQATRLQYTDTLYNYALKANNDSLSRTALFEAVRAYYIMDQNEPFLSGSRQMFQLSKVAKDTLYMAKALSSIGDYYEAVTELDSAFTYYSKSEHLFRIVGDPIGTGKSTLYKVGILYEVGIFTESEVQTTNALQFLITTKSDRLVYEAYNLMGLNLSELDNYGKSFDYYRLALGQLDVMAKNNYSQEKLIKSRASVYNNLGNLFLRQEQFSKAVDYYKKGLNSSLIKKNHPSLYATLLDNLAYAKMRNGSLPNVEPLFLEAAKIRDSLKNLPGIVTGNIHLGQYYLNQKDTLKGITYLENGLKKARTIGSTYDVQHALKLLSLNSKKNVGYYNKEYVALTDSLQNLERNTRNKFARIAYETDLIEEKNEILTKKYGSLVILSGVIILLIAIVFIIYRLRTKNKELQLIHNQQKSNEKIYQLLFEQQSQNQSVREEERNRIAMELHDGIVNRIFTTRFNLMQLTPEQIQKKELLVQELIVAETEIRKVSHDLQRNILFEDDSFQKALGALVSSQSNAFGTVFNCSIDSHINWSLVPSSHKIHIYRICQEALQNVNKYAQASKCFIFLLKKGTKISLQITDDGIGFDSNDAKVGIGLKNIQQRVKSMEGSYQISSDADGTIIAVVI